MTRAYIRVDPGFFDRKVFEDKYPLGAVAALMGCLCYGETQSVRGTFRDATLLRALLGPGGRWVPYLIEHGDLIQQANGNLYIDGWHEWQEGDVAVPERMRRLRARRAERDDAKRNGVTFADVTPDVTDRKGGERKAQGGAKRRAARRNDGTPITLSEVYDA